MRLSSINTKAVVLDCATNAEALQGGVNEIESIAQNILYQRLHDAYFSWAVDHRQMLLFPYPLKGGDFTVMINVWEISLITTAAKVWNEIPLRRMGDPTLRENRTDLCPRWSCAQRIHNSTLLLTSLASRRLFLRPYRRCCRSITVYCVHWLRNV